MLLQASSQGPPISAVVYAAAGRWAQHRSPGAVVTVQRVRRRLQIFRLTYLLTYTFAVENAKYSKEVWPTALIFCLLCKENRV